MFGRGQGMLPEPQRMLQEAKRISGETVGMFPGPERTLPELQRTPVRR